VNISSQLLIAYTSLDELTQADVAYTYDISDSPPGVISVGALTSNVNITYGTTTTFSGAFNIVNDPVDIYTNTEYLVEMSVNAVGGPTFTASAFVDPFIVTPPGYQLDLSPGILNGIPGGVPEPSTWAMLLAGFGCLGIAGYRRAKSSAARAAS
jgi:hypothetical protein